MGEVGTLDMGGGTLSDGAQFLDGGFIAAPLKTLVALTQGSVTARAIVSPVSRAIDWASLWASGSFTLRLRVCLSFCIIVYLSLIITPGGSYGTKSYNRSSLQRRFLNPSMLDAALPKGRK